MEKGNFTNGAFVFTRVKGLEPRKPDELEPLAISHGIDPGFIPSYSGDRTTISRAIATISRGLSREGFLLRPIKRTGSEVIYGIVSEHKDEASKRLDHDFEAILSWSTEPDPSKVTGDHEIAQRVAEAYRNLRGKIVSDDWSASITSYLESHDAARMRGDGRVYWVPPQRTEEIRKLREFLKEVGIDLILCEIEPEVKTVVEDVAQVSIEDELDRLQEEADAFDGKQRPSTYKRRLEEYQRLRCRATLYRDALGVGADRARLVLDELEKKVSGMLSLRKNRVVHHDGTESDVKESEASTDKRGEGSSDENKAPLRLGFGGATFTYSKTEAGLLTFVSDEEAAKTASKALESMGLAGVWQNAGLVKLQVQNSGPEGAAVSLRLQIPSGSSLESSSTSLASLGVTFLY